MAMFSRWAVWTTWTIRTGATKHAALFIINVFMVFGRAVRTTWTIRSRVTVLAFCCHVILHWFVCC